MEIKVGMEAPLFELSSTLSKEKLNLKEFRNKKNVLVAFYPLDFTPGWIKEITSWKEDYKKFEDYNCEVIAISVDHIYAHNVFAASIGTLPYPLCSDWHKETCQEYGVYDETNLVAKRSVFIVDRNGTIQFINKDFDADNRSHYEEVFNQLNKLK